MVPSNQLNLWAELEGVLQDCKHADGQIDDVCLNTIWRVKEQLGSQQHIMEAFSALSYEAQLRLLSRMTLITQDKTLKDLTP